MMKTIVKVLNASVRASFTIEAAFILPIVFVITVWFITTSFTIHSKVLAFSEAIFRTIKDTEAASDRINIDNLDGRTILLKYKLLKDGLSALTGGLDDED
ncbi:MAG: hypothetical protein E7233_01840 [Lachnospiraceae bacterium]|nr:hypothetical protein [Lachnospiraceae bacterium]